MKKTKWVRTFFILYILVMLLLLFGRESRAVNGMNYRDCLLYNSNFLPFHSIRGEIAVLLYRTDPYIIRYAVTNLFGNIILFIPYGLLLALCFRSFRRFWKTLSFGAFTILWVELLQLFSLRGSFDVDDLILNMMGIAMGYGVFMITKVKMKG